MTVQECYSFIRRQLNDENYDTVSKADLQIFLNNAIATVANELIVSGNSDLLKKTTIFKEADGNMPLPDDFKCIAGKIQGEIIGRKVIPYDNTLLTMDIVYFALPIPVSIEGSTKINEVMPFYDEALNYRAAKLTIINAMNMLEENVAQDIALLKNEQANEQASAIQPKP